MTEQERGILETVVERLQAAEQACRKYADTGMPGDAVRAVDDQVADALSQLNRLLQRPAEPVQSDLEQVKQNLLHGSLFTRKPED